MTTPRTWLNRTLILLAVSAAIPAYAQSRPSSDGISKVNSFSAQVNVTPSIGTHCAPDFFVVNSIPCPQSPNGCPPRCHGKVHRFLPDHRYHASNADEMIAALQPGVPVCLVIHGSFVAAKDLYPETIARYKRITASSSDRPMHFIAAHWPSDPGLLILPHYQVNQLGRHAEFNGIYVAQLIARIPPENPICLLGHSHGCRVIASAMHLLGGGRVRGFTVADPCPQRRIRAVLGAAAIDRHWLNPGERYGCAVQRLDCLLNVKSRHDLALNLYPLREPLLHHALGQAGFLQSDLIRMGPNARKMRELDVTHLVAHGHMISSYARHPQIQATYVPYLFFD